MSKNLLVKIASVALAIFLSVTLLGFAFSGVFAENTNNSAREVYLKVEKLSEEYKQNLLILVEHEPSVVQAKSSNAKIGEEIKGLMNFQPVFPQVQK